MIWRLALAVFLTLVLALIGTQPRAQFNGCSPGFCSSSSTASHVVSFSIGNVATNNTWASGSTTATATISLSAGSEVFVHVCLTGNTTGTSNPVVATPFVTSASLTFTKRSSRTHVDTNIGGGTPHDDCELYWAPSSGALTNQVITVTSSVGPDTGCIMATELKGSFTLATPFDVNGSLPKTNDGDNTAANVTAFSTTSANTAVFYQIYSGSPPPGEPTGFTQANIVDNLGSNTNCRQRLGYQLFTSAQSGVTITSVGGGVRNWIIQSDAVAL
jgi:hypothetical protein